MVDSVLLMASLGIEINMRKVMETLLDMRTYRMGLIQTADQLQFSVEAIIQGLKSLEVENVAASPHQVQLNGKRLKDKDSEDEDDAHLAHDAEDLEHAFKGGISGLFDDDDFDDLADACPDFD